MERQLTAVYVLGERLFVQPMAKTIDGVWAALETAEAGTLDDHDAGLGELVARALDRSRIGQPHPSGEQLNHLLDPLVRMSGIRHVGEFHRRTALINVERQDATVRIARAVRVFEGGSTHAWFGEDAIARELVDPTREQLGATVRELALASETVRTETRAR